MPRNLQERTLLMFSPSWICGCLPYLLIISNSLKMLSKPLKREGTREQEGVWGIMEAFQWWEKNKQIREVGARLPSTGQQQSRIYQNCLPLPCYYMRRMGRRPALPPWPPLHSAWQWPAMCIQDLLPCLTRSQQMARSITRLVLYCDAAFDLFNFLVKVVKRSITCFSKNLYMK